MEFEIIRRTKARTGDCHYENDIKTLLILISGLFISLICKSVSFILVHSRRQGAVFVDYKRTLSLQSFRRRSISNLDGNRTSIFSIPLFDRIFCMLNPLQKNVDFVLQKKDRIKN